MRCISCFSTSWAFPQIVFWMGPFFEIILYEKKTGQMRCQRWKPTPWALERTIRGLIILKWRSLPNLAPKKKVTHIQHPFKRVIVKRRKGPLPGLWGPVTWKKGKESMNSSIWNCSVKVASSLVVFQPICEILLQLHGNFVIWNHQKYDFPIPCYPIKQPWLGRRAEERGLWKPTLWQLGWIVIIIDLVYCSTKYPGPSMA